MSMTRDDRIVEVTFPVRIKMRLGDVEGFHALPAVKAAIGDVLFDAATERPEGRLASALYDRTPPDDGDGSFGIVVDEPTVAIRPYITEATQGLRPHEVSP